MLAGQSPYQNAWFFGPPWALFPLVPLALLPEPVGRFLLLAMCFSAFAYASLKLGAGRLTLPLFLLSPMVLMSLYVGNLDGLVLLGAVLPPALGLFFLTIKPQVGGVLILFIAADCYRRGGPRYLVRTFAPISLAFLLSFIFYGPWPLRIVSAHGPLDPNNASLVPLSLPFGLALVVAAFRLRRDKLALAAGPLLTPYLSFQSYAACLVPLFAYPVEMAVLVAALWALQIG
jgi:hypothetical protein